MALVELDGPVLILLTAVQAHAIVTAIDDLMMVTTALAPNPSSGPAVME